MTGSHLSAETIDLMLLASLPSTEVDQARTHLHTCERCRLRWAELEDDKRRFEQFVFPRTLEKVQRRAQPTSFVDRLRERWSLILPAAGVAAAVAALVVAIPAPLPYDGIKGGAPVPSIKVVGSRGDAQFQVGPGDQLRPGDRIRFVVNPVDAHYVLIASVDSAGKVTLYYPYEGARSAALPHDANQELPGSIELDDALGTERLVAFFSEEPLESASIRDALSAGKAPADIASNTDVISLAFEKVAR